MLLVIGVALTLAPVVYVALERLIFVKVALVLALIVLAVALAVSGDTWRALPARLTAIGTVPEQLGFALLLGAAAFAGAGGGQNLCQSNWIRDKGFGMGKYVPRLVSPAHRRRGRGGERSPVLHLRARPPRTWRGGGAGGGSRTSSRRSTFAARQHRHHLPDVDARALDAVRRAGPAEQRRVPARSKGSGCRRWSAPWFGLLFWATGAFSLFGSAMGITDYTSRLAADVLKSTYLRDSPMTESRLYFWLVWGLVAHRLRHHR